MLPPDTPIPKSNAGRPRKRKSPGDKKKPGRPKQSKQQAKQERPSTPDAIALDYDSEEEEDPGPDSDPETSLDVVTGAAKQHSTRPTTVHWDFDGPDGKKVGWKVRLWDEVTEEWREGRVVLYDPYTHKHKVQYDGKPRKGERVDSSNCAWIRLCSEVRFVALSLI